MWREAIERDQQRVAAHKARWNAADAAGRKTMRTYRYALQRRIKWTMDYHEWQYETWNDRNTGKYDALEQAVNTAAAAEHHEACKAYETMLRALGWVGSML